MHSSLVGLSEAVETMRESCKAALPGPAKPVFRGQDSGSFSRNPRTFLAFAPARFGSLIWMLLRPTQIQTLTLLTLPFALALAVGSLKWHHDAAKLVRRQVVIWTGRLPSQAVCMGS